MKLSPFCMVTNKPIFAKEDPTKEIYPAHYRVMHRDVEYAILLCARGDARPETQDSYILQEIDKAKANLDAEAEKLKQKEINEKKLAELLELDKTFKSGSISERDYQTKRSILMINNEVLALYITAGKEKAV